VTSAPFPILPMKPSLPPTKLSKGLYLIIGLALVAFLWGDMVFASRYAVLPETSYNLLTSLPLPSANDRILVVSPHPDDETLGAGGFIEEAVQQHATVRIALATDGNKHGLKDIRHQEIINSTQKLGLTTDDITFFNFPDGDLTKQSDFLPQLEQLIANYQPTIILGTHPQDIHPDHAMVGRSIDAAAQASNLHPSVYYFVIHYHRYPRPLGYKPSEYLLPPAALITADTHWETLPLSDSQRTTKEAALREYHSQMTLKNPILTKLMLSFVRKNEVFAVKKY